MNYLLNYLWEGSITLLLLYGFYRLFLTDHTFFGWNRTYLILSMGMALIIPLLSFQAIFFHDSTALSTNLHYFLPEFELTSSSESPLISVPALSQVIIWIYLSGVMVTALRVFIGLFRIFQQISLSKRYSHQGHLISVHPDFKPSSFFHYLFLPEFNPTDHDHQLIITHEGIHSAYYHTLDTLFFQLIRIVFWFHPILKMVEGSLSEVHEYQVDKEITKSNSKTEYAHLLVNLILAERGQLVNHFNQFQIKKRIVMMGKPKSKLKEKFKFLLMLPLMGLLIVLFSCEQQEDAVPAPPPPPMEAEKIIEVPLNEIKEEVFDVVENMPRPQGGLEGWNQYLSKNLTYPSQARERGIEGTVYVEFVVNAAGSIQDVKVVRGIDADCDEEAVNTIKNSPRWEPGTQGDQEVNVKMRLPVRFALGK